MCDVANDTLFYLLSRPIVHAEGSALPFLVSFLSWGLITKVKVSMALLFTSDLLFFSVLSIMTCHVCASSIWSGRLMISISTVLDGSTTSFVQLTFRFLGSPFCLPDRSLLSATWNSLQSIDNQPESFIVLIRHFRTFLWKTIFYVHLQVCVWNHNLFFVYFEVFFHACYCRRHILNCLFLIDIC